MALRDSWHRTLVYFGLAEESDHDADYDGYDDEFEDGEEDFEPRRGRGRSRESANVRRLPTSRRSRHDEIDDIFADDEPAPASRTRVLRSVDAAANGTNGTNGSEAADTWGAPISQTCVFRSPTRLDPLTVFSTSMAWKIRSAEFSGLRQLPAFSASTSAFSSSAPRAPSIRVLTWPSLPMRKVHGSVWSP